MKQEDCKMRKKLTDTHGEVYVNTGIKVIIAVVIGALLLGGLYLLFGNVIVPQTEQKVNELMNVGGGMLQLRKNENGLEYSYDGETWKKYVIPGMPNDAKVQEVYAAGAEDARVWIMAYNSARTGGIVCASSDGSNWTPIYSDKDHCSLTQSASSGRIHAACYDGRSYYTDDGISWTMTSTKRY